MSLDNRRTVVVLGAGDTPYLDPVAPYVYAGSSGVVGLTTAVKIQEQGQYNVSVIAEVLPTDDKTAKYTSFWAGAHHVLNMTEDARQQKMELETFDVLWELSKPGSETEQYFMRTPQTEYSVDIPKFNAPHDRMPDHKVLPKEMLPPGVAHGESFQTVTIDTPNYIKYLANRLTAAGGILVRGSVQHIKQVLEGGAMLFVDHRQATPPDALVICTGLATRFLGGVEDKNIYPARGQTVLVRAPWIDFGKTIRRGNDLTYVIRRKSGDVILGGTRDLDDWYPKPRSETTRDILERTFAMCPELAPPEVRKEREPTIEDVLPLVIEEGCGFRPARTGGLRLDVEWHNAGKDEKNIPVVFNYGHAGYGFQSSWGSASHALALLEEALHGKY